MLVCPLQGIGGVQGKECFLRVTSAHLFEVELQAARTLERLELQSLVAAELESETGTRAEPVSEVSCGVRCLGRGSPESSLGTCWLLCATHWAWVFSIFSHENSVLRRSVCGAVVCDLGGWAKGWTLCKGFVSAPALWGAEFLSSSELRVAQTPFPLPTAVFSFLPAQGSGPSPGAPVLVLRFSYICPDRQLRRYTVLEPEAHEAIQVMEGRGWWGG